VVVFRLGRSWLGQEMEKRAMVVVSCYAVQYMALSLRVVQEANKCEQCAVHVWVNGLNKGDVKTALDGLRLCMSVVAGEGKANWS